MLGETPALHPAQALSDDVHLDDVRTTCEQLARDVLQLVSGHQRVFEQRASATAEQEEHRIGRTQFLHQVQCSPRADEGVLVRHGMASLVACAPFDRPHDVPVLGDNDTLLDLLAQACNSGSGHLPSGFARRDQKHSPWKDAPLQRALDSSVGQNGRDGLFHDAVGVCAQ